MKYIACDASKRHRLILQRWVEKVSGTLECRAFHLSEDACDKLDLLLFRRLEAVAGLALDQMLRKRLCETNPLAAFDMSLLPDDEINKASAEMLGELETTDCALIKDAAPLLLPRLDSCARLFSEAMQEMLTRLDADKERISDVLLNGKQPGTITDFSCDGGDLHANGRCAVIISTDKGKFVYKPHDCSSDVMYAEIINRWFSDISYAPRCVAGDGYGFCEFIEAESAVTADDVRRYVYNWGGMSALFQCLGSSDLHIENFIMRGAFPVLIDHETLLSPSPAVFVKTQPRLNPDKLTAALNGSLYPSSLLPCFMDGREMSPLMNRKETERGLPQLDGKTVNVTDHEDIFFEGFRCVYRRCMDIKDEFSGLLMGAAGFNVRRLIRATNYYASVQKKLYSLDGLASLENRKKITGHLRRFFENSGSMHMAAIAEAEERSLLRGDIPYFYSAGNGHDLIADGTVVIRDFFEASGIENACHRIAALSEDELEFEVQLLKSSFRNSISILPEKRSARILNADSARILSDDELIRDARRLFDAICENMLTVPGGDLGWLVNHDGILRATNIDLMHGLSGMGVFFAAYHSVTGDADAQKYADVCLDRIEEVVSAYESAETIPVSSMHAGFDGVGGILKALTHMGRANDRAVRLADRLTDIALRMDLSASITDVLAGISGLLLAASGLKAAGGAALAGKCADMLMNTRNIAADDGTLLWQTIKKGRLISGLGHGMAGVGAALMKAYEITGVEAQLNAARDAFGWENSIYSAKLGTWPDLRTAGSQGAMHGFCSGAPGIGLALASCAEHRQLLPHWQEDMDRALAACSCIGIIFRDHMCCGNSAAVDFLLEAGRRLGRDGLINEARKKLSYMILRSNSEFSYMPPAYSAAFSPSLFYGAAGIGLEILRTVDENIPSILI